MRRSILLSLMTVVMVATMLGIGSWAVFNDTKTAGPYTAQAGSLVLDLDQSLVLDTGIGDLKPSVPHLLGPFWVHNDGGNPGGLDLHFLNVADGPGGPPTAPEALAEWAGAIDDISNRIDIDYWVDGPYVEISLTNPLPIVACQSGAPLGKLADIESTTFDLGITANPSEWFAICISFHLDTFAGNEYQGDTSSFEIEFTLHQLNLGSLGLPAGTECVRLENKEAPAWVPILTDDLYGSVCYGVGSSGNLDIGVEGNGLKPATLYQLTLNGQDGGVCDTTDDQLASGSETYAGYDSGFWNGVGPNINQGACGGTNNEGIYNYAYVTTDAAGNFVHWTVIPNSGVADPADAAKVGSGLPSGIYNDVKFIVKEVTGAEPGTAWTPVLTEMGTLDFNLP